MLPPATAAVPFNSTYPSPRFLFLLPTSFSIPFVFRISPPQTLPFSRTSSITVSAYSPSSAYQFSTQSQQQYDSVEEDEHVIGDCVVFEDGIFEDPYLEEYFNSDTVKPEKSKKAAAEFPPEDLIPEKWKEVQAEINITKKEKRKIAQQLEFGRRVEKRRQASMPLKSGSVSVEEYMMYRDVKLAQLNPVVLDKPSFPKVKEDERDRKVKESEGELTGAKMGRSSSSCRVAPRNPLKAVYGGTLDDISMFFSSGRYDPNAAQKSEGPRKLFTKEEKVLLGKRIPDVASATSGKWLPLHTLAASGEFYLVDALLKHNVDINVPDKDGLTALHVATVSKKQAIFNYLLRESANPFVRDKDGATLMHYAVWTASSQMIKILLLYNVDINLQDNDGWTPLHLAVQSRRTDIVRLLLIKGADKTLKNKDGLTPVDLCLYSGRDIRTYELLKLMKQPPKPR